MATDKLSSNVRAQTDAALRKVSASSNLEQSESPEKDKDPNKLNPVMFSLPSRIENRSYISSVNVSGGGLGSGVALPSRRPFNVPKYPHKDPTSFDPNSTDHSIEDSPIRPRKRKVVESEAEADNLDDLIASLKRVAEREMKPNVFEKIKKKASSRNIPVESLLVEKLSLLNLPKRSELDDDLESLGSVDTDMAPASETSRDLECTYSDLESINESISSRGDVLSSTGVHPLDVEFALDVSKSPLKNLVDMDQENYKSEATVKLSSNSERAFISPVKNRKLNSNDKVNSKAGGSHLEILPVEKLEAMIAELDQVISDTDSSDEDSNDTPNRRKDGQISDRQISDTSEIVSDSGDSVAKASTHILRKGDVSPIKYSADESDSLHEGRISSIPTESSKSSKSIKTIEQSVKGVTFITSSEKKYPVAEKATFVTLSSVPTSEESISSKGHADNSNVIAKKFLSSGKIDGEVSMMTEPDVHTNLWLVVDNH